MNKYYEVLVESTGKAVGDKNASWEVFNHQKKQFATIAEVKKWLKDNYEGKSKNKIYIDDKNGNAQHIGYIYKLGITWDVSHNNGNKWYQQDWITISEIKSTPIIV